jgi:hypothetical protein
LKERNPIEAIAAATGPAAPLALTQRLDSLAEQRAALRRQQADAQLWRWAWQVTAREA